MQTRVVLLDSATTLITSGTPLIREKHHGQLLSKENEIISFRTGFESIVIHLSHLDYQYKKGYSFRYTIDGKNWFQTEDKGSIVLSDLTYGEYTLKIQMFDPFGRLVTEKSFPIVSTAPFYVKTSFHVFFALFVVAILILLWLNIQFLVNCHLGL